jgi:hypothetical protein
MKEPGKPCDPEILVALVVIRMLGKPQPPVAQGPDQPGDAV